MCLFKKKKKEEIVINSKFLVGDSVSFRRRDELTFGWIYAIHLKGDDEVYYDVQIGGQCPAIIYDIKESELRAR